MDRIDVSETFPYRAEDLIELVLDVEKYTEISNYVKSVEVEDKGDNTKGVLTTIEAPFLPVALSYGCDLQFEAPNKIKAIATKSPFKEMRGELVFNTLENGHTQVDCTVEYRTGWSPVAFAAAQVMKREIDLAVRKTREYLAQRLTAVDDQSPSGNGPAAPSSGDGPNL